MRIDLENEFVRRYSFLHGPERRLDMEKPIDRFIDGFILESARQYHFTTSESDKDFSARSNENVIRGRATILRRWLADDPTLGEKDITYARSILSEIVVKDALNIYLSSIESSLFAFNTPSTMDATKKQRGGDIIVGSYHTRKKGRVIPKLLIDVTLSRKWIAQKFKYPQGRNDKLETQVVILALGGTTVDVPNSLLFKDYLDQQVKPAIQNGLYEPTNAVDSSQPELFLISIGKDIAQTLEIA